jgi:N-acetylglucosamine-6-phosphate deacetylase
MKTTLLTARRLIATDGVVENPQIAIHADGTIASIESGERDAKAADAEAAGAEETTLTPAFFDIHVHGRNARSPQ